MPTMICLARVGAKFKEVAGKVGITERAVQKIVRIGRRRLSHKDSRRAHKPNYRLALSKSCATLWRVITLRELVDLIL